MARQQITICDSTDTPVVDGQEVMVSAHVEENTYIEFDLCPKAASRVTGALCEEISAQLDIGTLKSILKNHNVKFRDIKRT